MNPLTYPELVHELFPRITGGIHWGLGRTRRLLAAVQHPERSYPVVHVGGTNGKGSVAAMAASILESAGCRTGLYTSPHLCDFRERIRIHGRPIEEGALLAAARRLWPAIEKEAPSFFEATTAIAFLALAEADVDVAIVEVGLGGRLDATNVVHPAVTVLTNVAMDHAQHLGNDVVSIAAEKAGIIKAGTPALTAERAPAALSVFRKYAQRRGAKLIELVDEDVVAVAVETTGTRFRLRTGAWGELEARVPLVGAHQALNAALAVGAVALLYPVARPDPAHVLEGLASVRWPGRFEVVPGLNRTWVFDVAHNPAAVAVLCATLDAVSLPRPHSFLVGVLGDKDWAAMLPPLLDRADAAVLTCPPGAPPERCWDPAAALAAVGGEARIDPAFHRALDAAADAGREGTVVVTGSFHTVGGALSALGMDSSRSPAALPAGAPAV